MSGGVAGGWTAAAWRRPVLTMLQSVCLMVPLGGCLLTDKPDPGLDIPQAYDRAPRDPALAEAALPPLDWWRGFRSHELIELIEEARASNLDIAAAVARIVQADAQSRVAGAALLPSVQANGNASRAQASKTTGLGNGQPFVDNTGFQVGNTLTASLSASYELDFWGKNRSAMRAAEELAVASRYDREVVGLATVVSTANAYFQVLAAQDRLKVANENLQSATRVLNLIQQRLNAGTASALDTAQQEALVNNVRATIPPLEQSLVQNRSALALLIARPPEHVKVYGGSLRSIGYPRVTPGLPSELLTQRPDIREAEANLASANANVENARAQMLPSINLTGAGGYRKLGAQVAVPAGIGVLQRRRRADPADLRRRKAAGQSRPAEGQAGRAACRLPQGGDLRLRRRRKRARRHPANRHPREACCAMW